MIMMTDRMEWSDQTSSPSDQSPGAPTIKNHSVTHFKDYLYCFGGYDGRRNHNALLIYSIKEKRWIRPHHVGSNGTAAAAAAAGAVSGAAAGGSSAAGSNNAGNPSAIEGYQGGIFGGDTSVIVTGTPPPGRNGHSATLATDPDDEENGRIIIIGGWLGTGPLAASDMHVLEVSANGRQLRWYQPAVKGTPPGPCNMHSADYVTSRKEVYVFRGGNGREYLNDLHALCTTTLTWRQVQTTGTPPQQRANHSSAILEETEELFIFGGWNGTERLNDIHILDTKTSTWTSPHIGGFLPHPRAGMTLTALRGRLFLFGGSGTSSKCFDDLQILDRSEMAWLDVTQQKEDNHHHHHNHLHHLHPSQPTGQMSYYTDSMAVGGMQDGGGMEYTPVMTDYRQRELPRSAPPAASPNPNDEDTVPTVMMHGHGPGRRAGHTATAVNRKIYIFGGSCGSDYLNDFYVLDTDPPPKARVTEPTSLQLVKRQMRHYFNSEEFSDVIFVVQDRKVYGHRLLLSMVSDCFRAMFTGGFRESESKEIEISDCPYDAFLAVMEYIYTDETPKVDQTSDRDISRVVDILELADKFFLYHLKEICETLLEKPPAIRADTVEYLLQVAQKTNAMQLQAKCEHFIRNRDDNP